MRVLFLGDIVGRAARNEVVAQLPGLRDELTLDFVVVNCENAAGGFGITPKICDALFAAGADVLTTGNHVWDKREIIEYIADEGRLLRPLNMVEGTPGNGMTQVTNAAGLRLTVVNIMTNLFMAANDPAFTALNDALVRNKLARDANLFSLMCMARQLLKKWHLAITLMAVHRSLLGLILMFPRPIYEFCPAGQPTKQMLACVVIMIASLAWKRRRQ